MTLQQLNALPAAEAHAQLERCCGARAWAAAMASARPFASPAALHTAGDAALDRLAPADWLEAFAAHPRIGGSATGAWSRDEQAGVSSADASLLERLQRANDAYFQRFGFIFLIYASGKGAGQMLAALQARLSNEPNVEFDIAAGQQRLITHLRLDKLLS